MDKGDKARRDFLFLGTGAVAVGGLTMFARPLFAHMAPAADSKLVLGVDVDVFDILPVQEKVITYLGWPVLIRHRLQTDIEAAREGDRADMRDPETDEQRLRPKPDGTYDPRYLILHPICTYFGCELESGSGRYKAWYCPCCGAHYDMSGRIRSWPTTKNLIIPDYFWRTDTSITLRKRSIFTPS